jgi:hypothetical protein
VIQRTPFLIPVIPLLVLDSPDLNLNEGLTYVVGVLVNKWG